MRTKIILILCLLTSSVQADNLPVGCYVDFNFPYTCWTGNSGSTTWTPKESREVNASKYGVAVESIIYAGRLSDERLFSCTTLLNSCNESYSQEWDRAEFNGALVLGRDALIRKLRKACGSKCRRIK